MFITDTSLPDFFPVPVLFKENVFSWYIGLVWFLCFNGISTFVGYLMPKLFSSKNSSGTI